MGVNQDVAVIIPMYCEEAVIEDVINDVSESFEYIFCVDDGSGDNSSHLARKAGAIVVSHPLNLGQGAALQTGIQAALQFQNFNYFVTFDADGQHQVHDALSMVNQLRELDIDVVFGSRFLDERTQLTKAKKVVLKLATTYTNALCGMKLTDAHNGLRAFTREVAESIDLKHSGMAHATEIVNQIGNQGFRYTEQPVHIKYTDYSKSKGQSLWNSVNILFDLIIR